MVAVLCVRVCVCVCLLLLFKEFGKAPSMEGIHLREKTVIKFSSKWKLAHFLAIPKWQNHEEILLRVLISCKLTWFFSLLELYPNQLFRSSQPYK